MSGERPNDSLPPNVPPYTYRGQDLPSTSAPILSNILIPEPPRNMENPFTTNEEPRVRRPHHASSTRESALPHQLGEDDRRETGVHPQRRVTAHESAERRSDSPRLSSESRSRSHRQRRPSPYRERASFRETGGYQERRGTTHEAASSRRSGAPPRRIEPRSRPQESPSLGPRPRNEPPPAPPASHGSRQLLPAPQQQEPGPVSAFGPGPVSAFGPGPVSHFGPVTHNPLSKTEFYAKSSSNLRKNAYTRELRHDPEARKRKTKEEKEEKKKKREE